MLRKIKIFFQSSMAVTVTDNALSQEHKQQMAAAALFIEVLKSDFEQRDEEWDVVKSALHELFDLREEEIEQITSLAEDEVDSAVSLRGFTSCINDNYSNQEKLKIIEMLWRVALADGVLDKHENHIMRKIRALLYIPHKDYVRAKQQARLHNTIRNS